MATLKAPVVLKVWPNKDADVEGHTFGPADALTVVQDWGEVILVRDGEGRVFQVSRALLDM